MALSSGKKIVLVSTVIMAGSILIAAYALMDFMNMALEPPHKPEPLKAPIPNEVVSPPFSSPELFITGRNQIAQSINKAGGLGVIRVNIEEYFSANEEELQEAQADVDSLCNLYDSVRVKLSSHAAHAVLQHISDAPIPYIHPASLKKVSEEKSMAITTAGENVTIVLAGADSWKQSWSDSDPLGIIKMVEKPLANVFDTTTAEVNSGKLDTVKLIADSIDTKIEAIANNSN